MTWLFVITSPVFVRMIPEPAAALPSSARFVLISTTPLVGDVVAVNETDDGRAVFERVAQGLGKAATVAVGDRVWAETTLNLGRILGHDRLRTGSSLVNELRRVKAQEELDAMGRAIDTVEQTM